MTALTADRKTQYHVNDAVSVPVKASAKIYAGSMVIADSTGYAVPGADTATSVFRGIAMEQGDNSAGANAAVKIDVLRNRIARWAGDSNASFVQADIGSEVTILDDQTVSKAAQTTNDVACGILVALESATDVWVDHTGYCK